MSFVCLTFKKLLICFVSVSTSVGFRKVLKSYHQILKWWLQGLQGFNIGLKKVLRRFLKSFDGFIGLQCFYFF